MPDIAPHIFVIFGATGDLTQRKLIPALYNLMQSRQVATHCHVLGTSRSEWSDDDFREVARKALRDQGFSDEEVDNWCTRRLFFQSLGDSGDDFDTLKWRIEQLERRYDLPGNRAYYLSLPPGVYEQTLKQLGEAGLNTSPGWTRMVIEKPFGYDLESAQQLNRLVHRYFSEDQLYRIDHYLGKETVQNLMVFRFGNAIFESLWSREHIERVEITVAEDLGIGTRAGYYDQAGHIRDMIQNHLTQLMTLVAMEPPAAFDADSIRQEKVKVLRAAQPPVDEDVVLGQYAAGEIDGEEVPGYTNEENVPDDSDTETFVALRINIANWRWQGVPFYLRTGKRLPQRLTQIAVHFRRPPVSLFQARPNGTTDPLYPAIDSNILVITLQPDEGFDLRFEVKAPTRAEDENHLELRSQRLSFSYEDAFGSIPDAYETLLRDIITGDQTLFVRGDEVEASWRLYAPLLENEHPLHPYPAGTWGPEAARDLLPDWTPHADAIDDNA